MSSINRNDNTTNNTCIEWRKLGNDQLEKGDINGAIESYTKAIEESLKDNVACDVFESPYYIYFHNKRSNRSAAYALDGKFNEALDDAKKCIQLNPQWAKGYFRVAKALEGLNRYQDAISELEEAQKSCEDPEGLLKDALVSCRDGLNKQLLIGRWCGKVTEKLGGYQQIMEFFDNGDMRVAVMGKAQDAIYKLDTSANPMILHIDLAQGHEMRKDDASNTVSYIVRFPNDDILDMCCPYLTNDIPKTFNGPGFVRMDRINKGEKINKDDTTWIEATQLDELKGLSDRDIMLKYVKEFCDILKKAAKEGDAEFQVPEEKDEKTQESNKEMLKMLAINVKVNALEQKYGSEVVQAGFLLAAEQEEKKLDDREMDRAVMELRLRMLQTGIINEDYLKEARETLKNPDLVVPPQASSQQTSSSSSATTSVTDVPPPHPTTARARLQKKLDERKLGKETSEENKSSEGNNNGKNRKRRNHHHRRGKKKAVVSNTEISTSSEEGINTSSQKEMTGSEPPTSTTTTLPKSDIIEVAAAAAEVTDDSHNAINESIEKTAKEEVVIEELEKEEPLVEYNKDTSDNKEEESNELLHPVKRGDEDGESVVEVAEANVTPKGGEEVKVSEFYEMDAPKTEELNEAEMIIDDDKKEVVEVTVTDEEEEEEKAVTSRSHSIEEDDEDITAHCCVPVTPTMTSGEYIEEGPLLLEAPSKTEGYVPITPTIHTSQVDDNDDDDESSEMSTDPATAHGVPLTPTQRVDNIYNKDIPELPKWNKNDLFLGIGIAVGGFAAIGLGISLVKRFTDSPGQIHHHHHSS